MRHDCTAGAAGLKFMLDIAAMVHEPKKTGRSPFQHDLI